jgi:hypothetical protein
MRLGDVVKAPGVDRAISINLATYLGADTVSGSPAWSVATGLEVVGTPSIAANVATAIIGGDSDQDGSDYLVTCHVELASGADEDFTVLVKVRSGDEDPRLTR